MLSLKNLTEAHGPQVGSPPKIHLELGKSGAGGENEQDHLWDVVKV